MNKVRVLVVDDEPVITMQLEERLTSMGYDVIGRASSGKESVDMAKRLGPDVILMDIVMPGKIDGIDAAEIIGTEVDIPVIFLTAYSDDKFIDRAKFVDPLGYIIKPYHEEEIKVAIEVALYKKKYERLLRKSEEQYRSVVDNISDAVICANDHGNVVSWNRAAEAIFGHSAIKAIGKPLTMILPEQFREDYQEEVNRAVSTGKPELFGKTFELTGLRKGNIKFPLEICLTTWHTKEEIMLSVTCRDITEQKSAKDALERLVKERTAEVNKKNKQLVGEINKSKSAEAALRRKGKELHLHSLKLQQLNAALKVLLKQREEDRRDLEEKVLSNVKHLINPNLETLKKRKLDPDTKTYLDILESNLKNIISPFSHTLFSKYQNLTPTEIKVANMILNGKTTKEIAEFMGVSANSINHHRYHIRNKLGILTQKVNLRSYLSSLSK